MCCIWGWVVGCGRLWVACGYVCVAWRLCVCWGLCARIVGHVCVCVLGYVGGSRLCGGGHGLYAHVDCELWGWVVSCWGVGDKAKGVGWARLWMAWEMLLVAHWCHFFSARPLASKCQHQHRPAWGPPLGLGPTLAPSLQPRCTSEFMLSPPEVPNQWLTRVGG